MRDRNNMPVMGISFFDFSLIGLPQAEQLPAVQWKMVNLQRLMAENPSKHRDQLNLLEEVLEIHSKNND